MAKSRHLLNAHKFRLGDSLKSGGTTPVSPPPQRHAMIAVCEPIRWNLEHIPCNAGILAAIRVAYPGMPLHFYGEELHVRNLQRELGNEMSSSIVWKIIHIPPRHSDVFYRFWQDLTLGREISNRCQGYAEGFLDVFESSCSECGDVRKAG